MAVKPEACSHVKLFPQAERREESEAARCARLGFRPESAPTLLDVSPESSLSGIRHEEHGVGEFPVQIIATVTIHHVLARKGKVVTYS